MSEKLDRLIGERVMGWTVRESEPDDYERYNSGWAVCKWCPSTDISAAWEVRAEMKRRGFEMDASDFKGKFHVDFLTRQADPESLKNVRRHENECVAICLAALAALGVPESEIEEAMR